ncbi:MAG: T9SS type A sorting domain-containing protein [Prolixibacteraceae bacterium]|nr:T9SS type A sorting domain-containing protein [Prolixibacteraceae bacterium]
MQKLGFLFFLLISTPALTSAQIIYVDADATGNNNGTSWSNAYNSLQSALDDAIAGDEIWVAAGTYYPSSSYSLTNSPRYYHFEMIEGVTIFGGLAGNEDPGTYDLSSRDFETNETILSGDIGTIGNKSDNCYQIFYHGSSLNLTNNAILDGFTITGGNANGSYPHSYGGGFYNQGSSPSIKNSIITQNSSEYNGGGMYNYESSPQIINSSFKSNSSTYHGGAMYNIGSSDGIFMNCDFTENASGWAGAAMYNESGTSLNITNCTFSSNSAGTGGGAIYEKDSCTDTLINCVITQNYAANNGGGISVSSSSTFMTNCTVSYNSADDDNGGGINNFQGSLTMNNCIIWGNKAISESHQFNLYEGDITLNYCCYSNQSNDVDNLRGTFTASNNNITTNPRFLRSSFGDYRISGDSPCINAGLNNYNSESLDVRGENRIFNTTIDMGAYEWTEGVDPDINRFFVNTAQADDNGDGMTWETATKTLQAALDNAAPGMIIWIAKGTYYPTSAYDLTNSPRYYHFRMFNDVEIYGGFAGTEDPETFDINDRDYESNETILSGDIGTVGTNSDNCYHVFYNPASLGLDISAILDGVTITGGNADGDDVHAYGGGVYNYSSTPSFKNVKITNNNASWSGGGIFTNNHGTYRAQTNFYNCRFANNSSGYEAAAYYCYNTHSIIENTVFHSNSNNAIRFNASETKVINCLFISNTSSAIGAIYNYNYSDTEIINTTFVSNTSGRDGSAIYNQRYSTLTCKNSIIWSDNAGSFALIYNDISNYLPNEIHLYNCCYNDEPDALMNVSTVQNCITANPKFVGSDVNPDHPYALYGSSPCVNIGNDAYNNETSDIRGEARKQSTIDIGAYEWTEGIDPYYQLATWTGATNTDWATSTNWDIAAVPTNTNDVVIPNVDNDPEIATNAESYNLTVNNDAIVSINAGGTLSVNNTLTNNADTTGLVLNSTATETGRLVNNTAGVPATVKQYLVKDGWHYMGIPFTETPKASVLSGLWVTENDEATATNNTESGWSYLDTSSVVIPGKGYGIYSDADADTTVTLYGTLLTGDKTTNTTNTNEGWNFIANPYPCTIDWEVVNGNLSNVNDAIYLWDPTLNSGNGTYATYIDGTGTNGQTQYIAPMQGFFVKATAAGSVTFTNDAKTAVASNFKSESLQSIIRLAASDTEGRTDETVIRFKSTATNRFDGHMDAYKLKANSLTPQLYSVYNSDEYSINSIPQVYEELIIPLELMVKTNGEHTVALSELSNYNYPYPLILKNPETGESVNLQNEDYRFEASEGETVSLLLEFSESTTSSDEWLKNNIYLWSENQSITVSRMGNIASKVAVLNTSGQVVYRAKVQTSELTIPVNATGMYIVRVKPENGEVYNGKVVVR